MNIFASFLFLALMGTVLVCVYMDRRVKRNAAGLTPISVIVPCYNDGETVAESLRSIFASWPVEELDVIAVNDCSTDDSLARIREAAASFPIRVVDQTVNTGKAEALNRAMDMAKNDLVLCLDADTALNPQALRDMLARFAHNPRIGAVSCPYSPANRGFLPAMQGIEYCMLRLGQGAGNATSVLSLWGGCLMVRKDAFREAGGFSLNAITEDVHLAFKLNRIGWKVEQSFVFVRTHVPATWRKWIKQKMRWTAGGFQCVFKYPAVWGRNPLQMMFMLSYVTLIVSGLCGLMADTSLWSIGRHAADLWAADLPLETVWRMTNLSYGTAIFTKLAAGVGFSLFSLIYVLPTISRVHDWVRIVLIVPFSLGYFPLYLLVSLLGFAFWCVALRRMPEEARAW